LPFLDRFEWWNFTDKESPVTRAQIERSTIFLAFFFALSFFDGGKMPTEAHFTFLVFYCRTPNKDNKSFEDIFPAFSAHFATSL